VLCCFLYIKIIFSKLFFIFNVNTLKLFKITEKETYYNTKTKTLYHHRPPVAPKLMSRIGGGMGPTVIFLGDHDT
jgi:hypothetical protein